MLSVRYIPNIRVSVRLSVVYLLVNNYYSTWIYLLGDLENSPRDQYHLTPQLVRQPIDLSITYYWIEITTKEGSLYDFAKAKQKQNPRGSFMYIQAIGEKRLEQAAQEKRVILMDKVIISASCNCIIG